MLQTVENRESGTKQMHFRISLFSWNYIINLTLLKYLITVPTIIKSINVCHTLATVTVR